MPIRVTCPHCQAVYNLADHYRGKKVRRTKCQQVVRVGEPRPPKRKEPEDVRPPSRTDGGTSRPARPRQDAIQARPGDMPPSRRAAAVTAPARKTPVVDKRGMSPVLIAIGAVAALLVIVGVAIPAVWLLWPRQETLRRD